MFFSLRIALSSLAAHRLRTILAMAGVFLGALALSGVQHVSKALLLKAEQETERLGTNLFLARSGKVLFRRTGSAGVRNEAKTFTMEDGLALVNALPSVRLSAPFVSKSMPIRARDVKVASQIVATLPDYAVIRNCVLQTGRFLSREDEQKRAKVCVLGAKIAERLFGGAEAAMGEQVFFFRAGARVIGVMAPKGGDIVGTDQDEQVFVPLSTFMHRFSNQDWITGIFLQLADPGLHEEAKRAATAILRERHRMGPGKEEDFSVLTARDTMQVQEQALDLVQTLGLISSSVSFAVGGLGILSIMVLLVRVRRLEIGVRRAVGARRADIMRQFVLEAGVMAGVGGAVGVVFSMGLVAVICAIGRMPMVYEPLLLFSCLAGSVLLGLAAGAYPAWQAAHVQVLEVLKTE